MTTAAPLDRVPLLPRGVRLHHDHVRQVPVLLGPERALILDDIGHAILSEVDGVRSLDQIAEHLSEVYEAPKEEVAADMAAFLDDLADRQLIWYRDGG
jgi:pyrroloquinoline quinone biosynthesis protein D